MSYFPDLWNGETQTSEGTIPDRFIVNKFGSNSDVDAAEDIWEGGGDYTGQPITGSAETITITSGAGATDAAAVVRLFGLDASYALQEEDVTLNGSGVGVTVGTYWRLFRCHMVTPASGQTSNAGILTGTHTTTTANIFFAIQIGNGQTQVCCYTIPAGYTGYMQQYHGGITDITANRAVMGIWSRRFGEAVRLEEQFPATTDFGFTFRPYGGLPYPAKTDIRMRCLSVQNSNANVLGRFDLLLVED